MSNRSNAPQPAGASRREFLKTSTAAVATGALAAQLGFARNAHAAASDDTIKIALVGCGGRGTGAAENALSANDSVKLVALADVFEDRLNGCHHRLSHNEAFKSKVDVPEDRRFLGFDAYQKALDTDCDLVILATPPGFRPIHYEAAINAGKHVFMEKPVATDAPGVRKVLAATEEAKKKGLGVGVGLQRHHQKGYLETIKRLQDGAIGDIVATRAYWNQGLLWVNRRNDLLEAKKGSPLSEMEYQLRNWYYFVWICGDNIVEQHIHNLDVINWLKGDYPVKAGGMGGCEVRRGPDYGEIFDHHCVDFEYADGSRMFSQCRHMNGCTSNVSEHVHGTKGYASISGHDIRVKDGEGSWRFRDRSPDPYVQEHIDLIASIRAGSPLNEGENGAKSTMTAILGRMATYSGKTITWDDAINSQLSVMPTEFDWNASMPSVPGPDGLYALPIPGVTKVV